jgi:hypothetical protein
MSSRSLVVSPVSAEAMLSSWRCTFVAFVRAAKQTEDAEAALGARFVSARR